MWCRFVVLVALAFVLACSPAGIQVGTPCEEDLDCPPELTCDIHYGRGSCQLVHDD